MPCPQNDRDWNSWDDSPRTVEEHIEQYRHKLAEKKEDTAAEPEPDFFGDMEPTTIKQAKYYVPTTTTADSSQTAGSRLTANLNADIPISVAFN